MAKKTNYVSYELKSLERYLKQLTSYLDDNPPDKMEDRIEYIETPKGGTMIKVIADKEKQIKLWTETMQKLPSILLDINNLRKAVDGEEEDKKIRGDIDIPGFMSMKDDDDDVQVVSTTIHKKEVKFEDDDESMVEEKIEEPEEVEAEEMKQLPAPPQDYKDFVDTTQEPDFWDEDLIDE